MIDNLLRKLQLFFLSKTKNKGICVWDGLAMRVDGIRTWLKYRE